MKFILETTSWDVDYKQPNHIYAVDGDKIFAYSRWGKEEFSSLETPYRLDKRGRTFKEVQNTFNYSPPATIKVESKIWNITGSKGNTYLVKEINGVRSCNCTGYTYRGDCKHIKEIA